MTFIARNLAPNRVVLYLTTVADIGAVVLSLATDLDLTQLVPVITVILAINAKALMFVKGSQQMEEALYKRDLIAFQLNAQADAVEREAQAARSVGRPGTGPKVTLPR